MLVFLHVDCYSESRNSATLLQPKIQDGCPPPTQQRIIKLLQLNCQKYGIGYSISKSTFSGSRNAMVTSKKAFGWMVYKIAIGSSKQLFQTWKPAISWMPFWPFYWIKPWIHFFLNPMLWLNIGDWLQLSTYTLPFAEDTISYQKVLQHVEKQFSHQCQPTRWPFILDQTLNRDSQHDMPLHLAHPMQWHIMLAVPK